MLFVKDVVARFLTSLDGTPQKSEWWVKNRFAPEFKQKIGRNAFWYERDAIRWIDAQGRR